MNEERGKARQNNCLPKYVSNYLFNYSYKSITKVYNFFVATLVKHVKV